MTLDEIIQLIPGYDPVATAGDCVFDVEAALRAIGFVEECCTHVKGEKAGTLLLLEDWQKAIFANLCGWKRPDGTRRYRESLIYVPRGNSKTTMAAAIVNLVLFTDGEPGAELYSAAAEREQARLCFDIVTGMIRNEPEMEKRATLMKYAIVHDDSSYKALSSEAGSKHGANAHLVVIDELHAHKTPELAEVLMTSTGKRRQPLVIHLTTADFDRESICNQKHEYAGRVRDGILDDPSFLPVIYEASIEDDFTDPKTWAKANPNLGISVPLDYIERECKRAQDQPAYRNTFLRLHLNVKTTTNVACIRMEQWDACDARRTLEELKGHECYGALDMSSKTDITAFVLVFPDEGAFDVFGWYWAPEEAANIRHRDKNSSFYHGWSHEDDAGHKLLTLIPGAMIEPAMIHKKIVELSEDYAIQEICVDPWNAAWIHQRLEADGFEVIEFRQQMPNFTEPFKQYLALIGEGKIRHGGDKVLRWMATNLVAYEDPSGNIRPDKGHAPDKTDGQVAAIMALARGILAEEFESVYNTPGSLAL